MSNDLNDRLRAALRPVDPGESFTQKVLARIASEPVAGARRPLNGTPLARALRNYALSWQSAAALVTVVLAGLLVAHEWHAQRAQEGLEARRQVIEALRVTSEKLDLAYQAVNRGA
jgi:hypothetical protein